MSPKYTNSIGDDTGGNDGRVVRRRVLVQRGLNDAHSMGHRMVEPRPNDTCRGTQLITEQHARAGDERMVAGGDVATVSVGASVSARARSVSLRIASSHAASTSSTPSAWMRTSPTRTASREPRRQVGSEDRVERMRGQQRNTPRLDAELRGACVGGEQPQSAVRPALVSSSNGRTPSFVPGFIDLSWRSRRAAAVDQLANQRLRQWSVDGKLERALRCDSAPGRHTADGLHDVAAVWEVRAVLLETIEAGDGLSTHLEARHRVADRTPQRRGAARQASPAGRSTCRAAAGVSAARYATDHILVDCSCRRITTSGVASSMVIIYNHMVVDEVRASGTDGPAVPRAVRLRRAATSSGSCLRGEHSVSDLARRYPMSFAAVQKHVAVLERADLITKQQRGRERIDPRPDRRRSRRQPSCSTNSRRSGAIACSNSAMCSPDLDEGERSMTVTDVHKDPTASDHDDHERVGCPDRSGVAAVGRPTQARALVGSADVPGDRAPSTTCTSAARSATS